MVTTRGLAWALCIALTVSCGGGQTGQPGDGSCRVTTVSSDSSFESSTVAERARSFSGVQRAKLRWQRSVPGVDTPAPVDLVDGVTLNVVYEGASATLACDSLTVPVTLTVTSTASGIAETGPALLRFALGGSPHSATIEYSSVTLSLTAQLSETNDGVSPSGRLEPRTQRAPGDFAVIGAAP